MVPTVFIALPIFILLLFSAIALLVLFIRLCIKKPRAAAIIALVFFLLLSIPVFHFRVARRPRFISQEQTPDVVQSENTPSAIWSPGIEDEFKADIYPSKVSAIRSVGLRIVGPVRQVFGDQNSPAGFILFQGAHERYLVEEFGRSISKVFPEINWQIKPETAAVQDDEVGIRLDLLNIQTRPSPWQADSRISSGTIQATVLAQDKQTSIDADFVEKPWVDDFSGFLNNTPDKQYFIAKSSESCLSEAEANSQAMENARVQVTEMLKRTSSRLSRVPANLISQVNSNDILDGGFVLDRFVQSFEGAAGKIWRQAMLIEVSAEKLNLLARRKADVVRSKRLYILRTLFSIAGLLLLITVVYLFLNAATKGYYAWSLRIAGIVLALILIFLLLA